MGVKSILIFNENLDERNFLSKLLRDEEFKVFETSRVLEAIHILKREDIGIVLASQSLNYMESEELKEIIDSSRPGLGILFIGPSSAEGDNIPFTTEGFRQFLQDSLKTEESQNLKIEELKEFIFSITDRLLQIFEVDNKYFFNNNHLVASLSTRLAEKLGLDRETVEAIRFAALIKDIGKVGIHQKLFEQEKRFDSRDLVPIKTHPLNTVQILRDIRFPWHVDSIIAQHHEHYDGSGYPEGLRGRQISVGARIINIADSYVAMTTDRPYRQALSHVEATHEIMRKAGTQFDPEIVEIFMDVVKEEPVLVSEKRSILMLERQPNFTALLRLSVNASYTDVLHASSSFEAIRQCRLRPPDLVVADVEMLDHDNFVNFFNTLQGLPSVRGKPFILILPDNGYPRDFSDETVQYITKPVDMGVLVTAIKCTFNGKPMILDKKFEPAKGLSGTLEDFSLADITQILNLGLKTAKVELHRENTGGIVYLQSGKVLYAETGNLTGKKAFIEMASWDTGTFQILHGLSPESENIRMDTMHLLLESARAADERGRTLRCN